MSKKHLSITALLLAMVLVITCLGGCKKKEEEQATEITEKINVVEDVSTPESSAVEEESKEESSKQEESSKPEEPKQELAALDLYVNPLTGEKTDHEIANNRPVAFMINNISVAVPQVGVGSADIIFEAIVEGGMTRMMGFYQEIPDDLVIGSIRSLRHSYIDFAAGYDAIIAHCGGSNLAFDALERRGYNDIEAISWAGGLFYRDSWREENMGYEHSLMTTGSAINGFLQNDAPYRITHEDDYRCNMVFSEDPQVSGGEVKTEVDVDFGTGKSMYFYYDAETNDYVAEEYGMAYIDDGTGERVHFKNIVAIRTDVWVCDEGGHQDMTLTGSGEGWFCVNGVYAPIIWSRTDEDAQFEYTYLDGTPVTFGIGPTYIGVIRSDGGVY
ncbi:MAG: DUF3048 domain-containing protein [Firmicutes bacterium]|nr:DUF3048 domain-containing protein [Bacillota bacterium]